jgi:translation elongation factor EF-Ts
MLNSIVGFALGEDPEMLTGTWCRYYQEVCLLEQPYVMDDSQRVQDVVKVQSTLCMPGRIKCQCVS